MRTLMEKARAMIHGSGLSKTMWGEAVLCAAYLTNRSPTRGLVVNKTPFEMWYGRKPKLSNLRIFGCPAYAQIPKEKRQKLDPKSKRLVFVGYANNGYRLWNGSSRSIEIHRNVVFDETSVLEPVRGGAAPEKGIEKPIEDPPEAITFERLADVYEPEQQHTSEQPIEVRAPENTFERSADVPTTENTSERLADVPADPDHTVVNSVVVDDHGESDYESSAEFPDDDDDDQDSVTREPALRRSQRTRGTTQRYVANVAAVVDEELPQNITELKRREDWDSWKVAIDEEMTALEENKTWEAVSLPPGHRKPILSKWVFTVKDDGRYKARLVAKGCSQRPGLDYWETYAPVAKMESVRTVLALANEHDMVVHQMDVKTAFLNGNLEEVIFMQLPNDDVGKSKVVRLQKSLYGLKQAGRAWNQRFDDEIRKLGFYPLKSDCCVYRSCKRGLTLILYVDDILIAGKDVSEVIWIKTELGRLFQMKDLLEVKTFLGMTIKRDFPNSIIEISQSGYVEKVLQRFGMADCKPVSTPLDTNVRWTKLNDGEAITEQPFKELIGCLQYLATSSRPDICAAVSALSKYQASPADRHWQGLKRILRYLRGTTDTALVFRRNAKSEPLIGYADADFANDSDDRRSVSGYAYMIFGNLVSWSTKRQQTVSLSSTEAEIGALCHAVKEGLWLTNFLGELGVVSTPFTLMEDNIPCIQYLEEARTHQRMKHLDVKYAFIRDIIRSGQLSLRHISTEDQPADAFTKALPRARHAKLFSILNLRIEGRC